MLLSCSLYAIFTRFLLNTFFIYIWGYESKKSQQNYSWFNTLFPALIAPLAKSGPLDFPSEKSFLLLFAHEKGLQNIFQK